MSKKSKIQKPSVKRKTRLKSTQTELSWWRDKQILTYLGLTLLATVIMYLPNFSADFVAWDDPEYVLDNYMITSFSYFGQLWTEIVSGNYHPLTMFTLMINYAISGKSAMGYHVMNIFLHLMNVILVFHFIYLLSDKKWIIALLTALLFGIHPMHVESVAWVAERKDVLYTAFFMGGLIYYLNYLNKTKSKYLFITGAMLVLSLLSKPAAVIFPVVLLLIDWYRGRSLLNKKVWFEKIPFFALSVFMGILTLRTQSVGGAVAAVDLYSIPQKLLFACYGMMMYLGKLIVPINMTAFYPYPSVNSALPTLYYVAPIVLIFVAVMTFLLNKKWSKTIGFGMLFFLINLLLVSQLVTVGSAVMADRYTYVPYIGCFFIFANGYYHLYKTKSKKLMLANIGMAIYILSMLIIGFNQVKTWNNSDALWNHAIDVCPSGKAYTNRGLMRKDKGDMEGAMQDYTRAINMGATETTAYTNRGNLYFSNGQDDLALKDYNYSIRLDDQDPKVFANRGAVYSRGKKYVLAIADFNRSIELDGRALDAILNRAVTYDAMNLPEKSLLDYSRYIELRPKHHGMRNARSIVYRRLNQSDKAMEDLNAAISLDGNVGMYYQNRALLHYYLGQKEKAVADALKAQELGVQLPDGFVDSMGQ